MCNKQRSLHYTVETPYWRMAKTVESEETLEAVIER